MTNIPEELKKIRAKLNVLILKEIEGDCNNEYIASLEQADKLIGEAIEKIKKANKANKAS